MLDIIKDNLKGILDNANLLLEEQVPKTKKAMKSISIRDVEPLELIAFMKENNIPDNASFGGRDNGYDGFDDIELQWDVDVPTTDSDKAAFRIKKFERMVWYSLLNYMKEKGYVVRGYTPTAVPCIYKTYLNNGYDILCEYYSLRFIKK